MKLKWKRLAFTVWLAWPGVTAAQDTSFETDHQRIPSPGCWLAPPVWDAGTQPCTRQDHEAWLADIPALAK